MVTTATPHVFVVHGDLTELACDAIMIPTDSRLSIGPHWHAILPEHQLHNGAFVGKLPSRRDLCLRLAFIVERPRAARFQ